MDFLYKKFNITFTFTFLRKYKQRKYFGFKFQIYKHKSKIIKKNSSFILRIQSIKLID